MQLWLISLVTVLAANGAFAADGYDTYRNPRFGYSIEYPATTLYPQGESDNGDGQRFVSKHADATLVVYGSNNVLDESLADKYLEDSRGVGDEPKRVVTYKAMKDDWYVVSGYDSGKVFYQKTFLRDEQFKTFRFEYDEGQKTIYDPIAGRISKSFKSFNGL